MSIASTARSVGSLHPIEVIEILGHAEGVDGRGRAVDAGQEEGAVPRDIAEHASEVLAPALIERIVVCITKFPLLATFIIVYVQLECRLVSEAQVDVYGQQDAHGEHGGEGHRAQEDSERDRVEA